MLILDNIEEPQLINEILPTNHQGCVLLTTRAHTVEPIALTYKIEIMPEQEGVLFLLHRTKKLALKKSLDYASSEDYELAKGLWELLVGLPLALDQAGAYILETQCSMIRYAKLYQQQQAKLLKLRGTVPSAHPESVFTTFSLAFKKVRQTNRLAADLLRLGAFLYPEAIPEEIITTGLSKLNSTFQAVEDALIFDEALRRLLSYSLIHRDADNRTITLHRLVQTVLKELMDKQTQKQWAERVVKAVIEAFPDISFENWQLCQEYLPQALVCVSIIDKWELHFPEAGSFLNQIATYLQERGQYPQALPLFQRALAIRQQTLGPSHPDTADGLNNLALLYKKMGNYFEALPLPACLSYL